MKRGKIPTSEMSDAKKEKIIQLMRNLYLLEYTDFEPVSEEELVSKELDFIQSLRELKNENNEPYFSSKWLVEKYLSMNRS